mmetsp:Transcript_10700/g.49144  ORF Transcript_10700/g.49144 Transcript_10700/m.49144 type:complete len:200 (-) Transcript_10700:664-1263(-)
MTPSPGSLSNKVAYWNSCFKPCTPESVASRNCCVLILALDVFTASAASDPTIVTVNSARIFGVPSVDPAASVSDVIATDEALRPAAEANASRTTSLRAAVSSTHEWVRFVISMDGVHTCVVDATSCAVTEPTDTCANSAMAKRSAFRRSPVSPASSVDASMAFAPPTSPAFPNVKVISTRGMSGAAAPGDHSCVPFRVV